MSFYVFLSAHFAIGGYKFFTNSRYSSIDPTSMTAFGTVSVNVSGLTLGVAVPIIIVFIL